MTEELVIKLNRREDDITLEHLLITLEQSKVSDLITSELS